MDREYNQRVKDFTDLRGMKKLVQKINEERKGDITLMEQGVFKEEHSSLFLFDDQFVI